MEGLADFILATRRTGIGRAEEETVEAGIRAKRAAMEERTAVLQQQMEERRQRMRAWINDHKANARAKRRRYKVVTQDVLMHVRLRIGTEGLSLTRNTDPMYDDDPLFPYFNWDTRAKQIVREVVVERKGEIGIQVVAEVEEIERQFLENEREGASGDDE